MKTYSSVSVKCGKIDPFVMEDAVCAALEKRFPSFRSDGGGMCVGSDVRDVFFEIDSRSVSKVAPYLNKQGFKIA